MLALTGVLIAHLINDDKKATRVKWSWIGLGAWILLLILSLIVEKPIYKEKGPVMTGPFSL